MRSLLAGTLLAAGAGSSRRRVPPRVVDLVDRIPFMDKELFVLGEFLSPGGVFVDVGAAGGVHALVASRQVGPDGRVIAIEARPGSAAILRRWRNLLGRDNVTVLATALGAEPGSMQLRVPLVPTRSHALEDDGADDGTLLARLPARTVTVGVTTLDLVVTGQELGRVDLVKIDVEGAEPEVLAGATGTIETHRPVLLLEVFDPFLERSGNSSEQLMSWLVDRGYGAHVFVDEELTPVTGVRPDQYNYVFVPN